MSRPVAKSPSTYRCNPLPELIEGRGVCLLQHFNDALPEMTVRQRAQRWLHQVLAAYLAIPVDQVRIARTATGKPWLPEHTWLRFNLTHSGHSAAITLCREYDVGVDLEKVSGKVAVKKAIAQRFFHPDEQRWLALDEANYLTRFTQLWSMKEAWLKARGTGLTQPLRSFCVIPQAGASGVAQVMVAPPISIGQIHYCQVQGEGRFCLAYGAILGAQQPSVQWQLGYHQTESRLFTPAVYEQSEVEISLAKEPVVPVST
ncbi:MULTISPECIES: 4'-phosphopantetheinyl transferase family protein [Pseudomonas]|jgi:4'-phosphopantetheinyl transferase|uniref:4-phosphopantetheinyl transferase n=1 Tax=Pseudomonas frederiksbergensis TaxID=104087 RepID=A0AB33EEU1_9PSED|nr:MULTISPECIES: 4'-phosphopantetheinyl transferase superfamily protein [Pseudomonas]ATE77677.1 4-phosphopantetheinyl transferase [Pseudomonas frederiksbergensis]CAH0219400.1 4'-phosphopantetheinyl transferase sfp [Pseudomonas sp. Bi123]